MVIDVNVQRRKKMKLNEETSNSSMKKKQERVIKNEKIISMPCPIYCCKMYTVPHTHTTHINKSFAFMTVSL